MVMLSKKTFRLKLVEWIMSIFRYFPSPCRKTDLFEPDKIFNYFASEGHKDVEGWLSAHTLSLVHYLSQFQGENNISGNVIEIGVFHGRFFIALCLLLKRGEKALAIDVFEDQQFNLDGAGKGDYGIFSENLIKKLGSTDHIEILKADSLRLEAEQVLKKLGGVKSRLFSVDGCHTVEHTQNDLLLAAKTIAPGGIIILDDIENQAWPGVWEGARLFLQQASNIVPVAIAYNKLYLTTIDFRARYLAYLLQLSATQTDTIENANIHGHKVLRVLMPTPESLFPCEYLKVINFSSRSAPENFLIHGWSFPEPWGVWSIGRNAVVKIDLPDSNGQNISMMISLHGFVTENNPQLEIDIQLESEPAETLSFCNGQEYINWKHLLPAKKILNKKQLIITFDIKNPKSPKELGCSEDLRALGIGLRGIYFYR